MSSCIDRRMFTWHESAGSGKTTREKGGRNPPDVSLLTIIEDLLSFFNQFVSLNRVNNEIEEKYDIEKGYCWPADDIKRAWGKTQRMAKESYRRRHWALVILLQVIKKRLYYEKCKIKSAQSDLMKGNSAQSCSEWSLSDSSDQMEAEIWNVSWEAETDHWLRDNQACGTEQSITGDTEDGSTPSNAELMIMTPSRSQKNKKTTANKKQVKAAAKPDVHAYSNQTENVSSPSQSQPSNFGEYNMCNFQKKNPPIYIRIPFFYMPSQMSTEDTPNVSCPYKLIDELPQGSSNDVRTRKSYVMSYNTETKNAQWVYEILNKMTLQNKCKEDMTLGKNEFKNKSYDQGHLAAAANHKWCQEAYHDTYLLSNMAPQLSQLNKGMWAVLECYCRDFVKNDSVRNVHVYTGPLYLEKEKQSKDYVRVPKPKNEKDFGGKALPTHFFKVVIVEKTDGTILQPECYLVPNKKKEYKKQMNEEEEEENKEEKEQEEENKKEKEEQEEEKEKKKEKEEQEEEKEEKKEENKKEQEEENKEAEEKEAKAEKAKTKKFLKNIDEIENLSGLKFKSRKIPNTNDKIKSVILEGENRNGELHSVVFEINIIPSHSKK